jgi:hypothetical protein
MPAIVSPSAIFPLGFTISRSYSSDFARISFEFHSNFAPHETPFASTANFGLSSSHRAHRPKPEDASPPSQSCKPFRAKTRDFKENGGRRVF